MSKEYKAKVFKSGNSMALRLPKDLGFQEGTTMVLREDHAKFSFEPIVAPRQTLDVGSFWGKAAGMVHVPSPREDFEERPSALKRRG
jgi:antitoxin VapB